jgi:hypothetical protein
VSLALYFRKERSICLRDPVQSVGIKADLTQHVLPVAREQDHEVVHLLPTRCPLSPTIHQKEYVDQTTSHLDKKLIDIDTPRWQDGR